MKLYEFPSKNIYKILEALLFPLFYFDIKITSWKVILMNFLFVPLKLQPLNKEKVKRKLNILFFLIIIPVVHIYYRYYY